MKKKLSELKDSGYYAIFVDCEGFFMHFFTVQGRRYCSVSARREELERGFMVFKSKKTAEKYAELIREVYRDSAKVIEVHSSEFNRYLHR